MTSPIVFGSDVEGLLEAFKYIGGIVSTVMGTDLYFCYSNASSWNHIPAVEIPYGRLTKIKFPAPMSVGAEVMYYSSRMENFLHDRCDFGTGQHFFVEEVDLKEAFLQFFGITDTYHRATFPKLMELVIMSEEMYASLGIRRARAHRRTYEGLNLKTPKPRIVPKSTVRQFRAAINAPFPTASEPEVIYAESTAPDIELVRSNPAVTWEQRMTQFPNTVAGTALAPPVNLIPLSQSELIGANFEIDESSPFRPPIIPAESVPSTASESVPSISVESSRPPGIYNPLISNGRPQFTSFDETILLPPIGTVIF